MTRSRSWLAFVLSACLFSIMAMLSSTAAMAFVDPPPGDFDGDGVPDEPEPLPGEEEEGVAVYSGSNGSILQVFGSPYPNGLFGFATAIIADVNGNGTPDLLATAPLVPLEESRGIAYLMAGNSGSIVRVLVGPPGETFGVAAAQAADWDGDGRLDVRVSSRFVDEHGDIYDRDHIFSPYNGSQLYEQHRDDARLVAIAEDLDRDGVVDADDVSLVNNALGQTGAPGALEADLTGDGVVDADDVAMVVARLGEASEAAVWAVLPTGSTPGAIAAANELRRSWLSNRSSRLSRVNPGTGSGSSGGSGGDPGGGSGTGPGGGGGPSGCCERCDVTVNGPTGPICFPNDQACFDAVFSLSQSCCYSASGLYQWSVTGGDIIGPATGASIVVRICQPGNVGVSGWYGDTNCGSGDSKIFKVVGLDLDADSNNDALNQFPDRSLAEEAVEDKAGEDAKPGKVIVVNSLDDDGDSLPDFADGYDLEPRLDADDGCTDRYHVPIIMDFIVDWSKARIRIDYDASDPLEVTATMDDPCVLPSSGRLRLWLTDGTRTRDPRPAPSTPPGDQGGGVGLAPPQGDFVAPGEYAPQDLLRHYVDGSGGWVIYAEAVKQSTTTGDIAIRVEVDPDGPDGPKGWMCSDQIRLTAVEISVLGKNVADVSYGDYGGVTAATFDEIPVGDLDAADAAAVDLENLMVYAFRIHDPRDLSTYYLYVDEQPLPLSASAPRVWATPDFVCRTLGSGSLPTGMGPSSSVTIAGLFANLRYNPQGSVPSGGPQAVTKGDKVVALKIREVIEEMEAMRDPPWSPAVDGLSASDSGAFGKAVHKRVADKLRRDGWWHDVWVKRGTNEIVAIDTFTQPPGTIANQIQQVDILHLEAGYTPQVGQILDRDRILDLYELKFTLSEIKDTAQIQRLKVIRGGEIKLGRSVRHWIGGAWKANATVISRLRKLGIYSAGVLPVIALVGSAAADETWDTLNFDYDDVKRQTDPLEKKLSAVFYAERLADFLGSADPTGNSGDLVKILLIYRALGLE